MHRGDLQDAATPTTESRGGCKEAGPQDRNGFTPLNCAGDIVKVEVLRAPEHWWWTDAVFTYFALALIATMWAVFYAVRWIGRGFFGRMAA